MLQSSQIGSILILLSRSFPKRMTKFEDIRNLIRYCVFLIFLGSGMTHLSGIQPYSAIFSQEISTVTPAVFGAIFIIFSIVLLLPLRWLEQKALNRAFYIPVILLFIHSIACFVKSGMLIEQFVEHALKLFLPLLFIYQLNQQKINENRFFRTLKILIALTFVGHAFFAIGIHLVPQGFIDMTTSILGFDLEGTYIFLTIAGILDIIFGVLILFRNSKIAYFYLIFWGILTAIARFHYGLLEHGDSALQLTYWFGNMLFRLPHGLVPLLLLIHINTNMNRSTNVILKVQTK